MSRLPFLLLVSMHTVPPSCNSLKENKNINSDEHLNSLYSNTTLLGTQMERENYENDHCLCVISKINKKEGKFIFEFQSEQFQGALFKWFLTVNPHLQT